MTDKLGISGKIKPEDKDKTGKPLMKAIMQVSLHFTFLTMITVTAYSSFAACMSTACMASM